MHIYQPYFWAVRLFPGLSRHLTNETEVNATYWRLQLLHWKSNKKLHCR